MGNGEHLVYTGTGTAVSELLDALEQLYVNVYAVPPYDSGPLYDRAAFIARTTRQASRPGFTIVWARSLGGELIGFTFGLPFEAGKWWAGEASAPPDDVLSSPKFAVIELVVSQSWRGRGIGRSLLDTLLADRIERYAVLTADPGAPARKIYAHWGWEQIGTARHTADAPLMDQLLLRR